MEAILGGIGIVICIGLALTGHLVPVIIGGIVGSFFGIAGFGGAVSGMIPGAILGGVLGYAFKKDKRSNPNDATTGHDEERKAIAPTERHQTQQYVGTIKHEWEELSRAQKARIGRWLVPFLGGFVGLVVPFMTYGELIGLPIGVAIGVAVGMLINRYLPGQRRLRQLERSIKNVQSWRNSN